MPNAEKFYCVARQAPATTRTPAIGEAEAASRYFALFMLIPRPPRRKEIGCKPRAVITSATLATPLTRSRVGVCH